MKKHSSNNNRTTTRIIIIKLYSYVFYIIIHYNILQTLLCRVQGGGLSIITIDITMVIGCMVYSNTLH